MEAKATNEEISQITSEFMRSIMNQPPEIIREVIIRIASQAHDTLRCDGEVMLKNADMIKEAFK